MVIACGFGFMIFNTESNYLHAADEEVQATENKINVKFQDVAGTPFHNDTIQVYENGKLSTRGSCSAGIFTMTVVPGQSSLLEFKLDGYHFEPNYIIVNEEGSTLQEYYPVTVKEGSVEEETKPTITATSNGIEALEFEHGDAVQVEISTTKPLVSEIYYNEVGSEESDTLYEQPFVVNAKSEEAHDIKLEAYYIQTFGDGTTKYSEQATITIHFKAKGDGEQAPDNTPTPTPPSDIVTPDEGKEPEETPKPEEAVTPSDGDKVEQPVTPTPDEQPKDEEDNTENNENNDETYEFVDENGKQYHKDQVSVSIEPMTEIKQLQQKINSYTEFQSIPSDQIAYLEISLFVEDMKVKPNGMYELTIPYPEGSTKDHLFVIYHFINGNVDEAENLTYHCDEDGIHVNVDSFSPFVIGWKDKGQEVTPAEEETSDLPYDSETIQTPSDGQRDLPLRANRNGVNTGDHTVSYVWAMLFLGSAGFIMYGIWKQLYIKK